MEKEEVSGFLAEEIARQGGKTGDSQAWRSFLKNQAKAIRTCDFLVQHTIGFRVLYVFIIMELSSRKRIHFNVTEHPTLEWTKQQVRNACYEQQPKFLLHDNDGKFGQLGRPKGPVFPATRRRERRRR
jgi:hypothetical protein